MNVNKLSKGQIFKNYKVICETLGVNQKTGKSKKLQLSDWERYFKYSKDGHNFIIDEIIEQPVDKVDLRSEGNNKLPHAEKMDDALLYILNKQDDEELFLTINKLLLEMNMINSNFTYGNRNIKKVSKHLIVEEALIEEFFITTKRTFKANIESMLNRLEGKSLIFWTKVKTVCIAKSTTEINELGEIKVHAHIKVDEDDNEHYELSTHSKELLEYRSATDQEIELILEVEDEVMTELGCDTKQELVVKDKWDVFMRRTNAIMQERANILFRYDSYKIIRNKTKMSREADKLDKLLSPIQINKHLNQLDLNSDVKVQLKNNWIKRHDKARLKKDWGVNNRVINIRSHKNYVQNGELLIDSFIDPLAKDICSEINSKRKIN